MPPWTISATQDRGLRMPPFFPPGSLLFSVTTNNTIKGILLLCATLWSDVKFFECCDLGQNGPARSVFTLSWTKSCQYLPPDVYTTCAEQPKSGAPHVPTALLGSFLMFSIIWDDMFSRFVASISMDLTAWYLEHLVCIRVNYLLSLPVFFFPLSTLLLGILSSSGFLIWSCFCVGELFCFAPLAG